MKTTIQALQSPVRSEKTRYQPSLMSLVSLLWLGGCALGDHGIDRSDTFLAVDVEGNIAASGATYRIAPTREAAASMAASQSEASQSEAARSEAAQSEAAQSEAANEKRSDQGPWSFLRYHRTGVGVSWAPKENYAFFGIEVMSAIPIGNGVGLHPAISLDLGGYINLFDGSGVDDVQAKEFVTIEQTRFSTGVGLAGVWDDYRFVMLTLGPAFANTAVSYERHSLREERKVKSVEFALRVTSGKHFLWGIRGGPYMGGTLFWALTF